MRGDRIPFSHILPVVDLALLVVLVFVPITITSIHLYQASAGSNQVQIRTGSFEAIVPRDQIVLWSIRMATIPKARSMMAINLPGSFIQWLISLPSRSSPPSGWHPQALALETWQALVFPFFALPFWWLVGCALDAILSKQRMHWSLLLIGTVFFALLLVATFVFYLPMPASDRADLAWLMKGLIGWIIAFAFLPIAWITQSIRKRRHPPPEAAAPSP
jgi:hypothetical protein